MTPLFVFNFVTNNANKIKTYSYYVFTIDRNRILSIQGKGKPNAPIIWDGVNFETVSISIHLLALCVKRVFHSTNLITKNINQRSCMCAQIFFQTGDGSDKTQALLFPQEPTSLSTSWGGKWFLGVFSIHSKR